MLHDMYEEEDEKPPGELNIVGLFEAEAASLLQAVDRGRILHATKNIRDSGALLETRFREIIGTRLPPHTQLAHGYLFDVDSTCTPQVDAMLLSAEDNHPMLSGDGGVIYAPFTCCKAFVEVKSQARDVFKQLTQTAKIAERLISMRNALREKQPDNFRIEQAASVLLIAKSGNAKVTDVNSWYEKSERHPTLVVFLDSAVVIARRPQLYEIAEMSNPETLEFQQLFAGVTPWLYRPAGSDQTTQRGKVLLWLYYFLLYCSTRTRAPSASRPENETSYAIPPVTAFIQAANREIPLVPLMKLSKATGQIAEL